MSACLASSAVISGSGAEIAFSAAAPSDQSGGYLLDQIKQTYSIPAATVEAWVRYRRIDKTERLNRRVGYLHVQKAAQISPYAACVPSSGLVQTTEGFLLKVSNQDAALTATFLGSLFTVSGISNIGGQESIAININPAEPIVLTSVVANSLSEVEIAVHTDPAIGDSAGSPSPFNRNLSSENTTGTIASVLSSPSFSGNLVDFSVGRLGRSVIADVGDEFAVEVGRRDNGGTESVKWALTFEVLPREQSLPQAVTYLGSPVTYQNEDLFYGA